MRPGYLLATALLLLPNAAAAQTAADTAGILAASRDYIDGYWQGDSIRMRRALHPELAKRQVLGGQSGRPARLEALTAEQMVLGTGRGGGSSTPVAQRKSDITIAHIFGNMATVIIDAGGWVDYAHLAKWNGEYKIVNIMFDFRRHQ